jgi:hypothetical protein
MPSFIPKQDMKRGVWTTVQRGLYDGRVVVQKQYASDQKERYFAELHNLSIIREIDFSQAVQYIDHDDSTRTLIYPYIDGLQGYCALEGDEGQNNLAVLLQSMVEEVYTMIRHSSLPFIFVPEGFKKHNAPYTYIELLHGRHDLLSLKILGDVQRLHSSVSSPSPIWGRYDPEFSNFIVNSEGVHHVDYESMALQDYIFPFAYALVHYELLCDSGRFSRNIKREDFIRSIHHHTVGEICTSNDFDGRLALNVAEVCSYLALETTPEVYPPHHLEDFEIKIRRSLSILEDFVGS